jgi:hypothetical protein
MNLRDLWEQDMMFSFTNALEDTDLGLTSDHSEFVFVDGEEGDYGNVKYSDDKGLVAVKKVYGGDSEELELTEYGKTVVAAKMMELFKQTLVKKLDFNLEI